MNRSYVTVHVGEETRARVEARTDPDESVEDWVRDAIHRRLDGEGGGDDGDERDAAADDDTGGRDGTAAGGDETIGVDGYEFVDDCGI